MIVMIMGMHRSGTSAIAGFLHKNGIIMGREDKNDFYPLPKKENPKGFFENIHFRKINDYILKTYNYRVKSFSPNIPIVYPVNGSVRNMMVSIINDYNGEFKIWGWKDPRTSLTAFAWLDVISQMGLMDYLRVILMKRSVEKIAASMRTRGNKEKFKNNFIELALKYYAHSHYYLHCVGYKPKVLTIDFENDLLDGPKLTAKRLSVFLSYNIIDYAHIDRSISRHN